MPESQLMSMVLPSGPMLAYRKTGNGPIPIVFIHGYSLSHETWERAIELLPARYTAYTYDLRGFGRSGRAASYTLDDHATDFLKFADSLGLQRVALVGHSLGSSIGQMLAVDEPSRFLALVFTNGLSRNMPPPDYVSGGVAERIAAYGSEADNRKVLESRMPGYFDPANVTHVEIARFVELGLHADTEALRQTLDSIYTHPAIPDAMLQRIKAPVLFVSGETDWLTPIEKATPARSGIPHAEFATIPAAGHGPMWEKPREWCDVVYGFFERKITNWP